MTHQKDETQQRILTTTKYCQEQHLLHSVRVHHAVDEVDTLSARFSLYTPKMELTSPGSEHTLPNCNHWEPLQSVRTGTTVQLVLFVEEVSGLRDLKDNLANDTSALLIAGLTIRTNVEKTD